MNELLTMLESKYKRLEYIQSTGTQYIDTGVKGVCSFEIVAQGTLENYVSQLVLARDIYRGNYFGKYAETYKWSIGGTSSYYFSENYITKQSFLINFETNGISVTCNNVTITNPGTANLNNNIYMFCGNDNGSPNYFANCKIYSAKCTQNNQIVRNFIPVLRKSDNEIGMLDLVEGKFYGNAGTGKFTANLDTMYALIQGNPTVQDGRVNGFSSSNYLNLSQPFNPDTKKWEVGFRITTGNNLTVSNNIFRSCVSVPSQAGRIGLNINITSASHFHIDLSFSGTAWDYSKSGTYTVLPNTNYYIKVGWNGNTYYLEYSTDGINYVRDIEYTSNSSLYNGLTVSQIGIYSYSNNYHDPFLGTIDLNRSYIKIDDTKYKLQAVVGYTKVGTLTENPTGVFSGFTNSDYLQLGHRLSLKQNFEFVIRINRFSSSSSGLFVCDSSGANAFMSIGNVAIRFYNVNFGSIYCYGDFTYNNYYYVRLRRIENIIYLDYSIDGKNYENTTSQEILEGVNLSYFQKIGVAPYQSNDAFNGSIDLNNTYIKINNKLWFNGLPNN